MIKRIQRLALLGVFMFASFISFIVPISAYAAAPQDTYVWQKNVGTPGCPSWQSPYGMAIHDDLLYVADNQNDTINVFELGGAYVKSIGSKGSGDGQFDDPYGVAFDSSGNMYVADSNNNRIQKFSGSGVYLSQFGTSGTGDGQLKYPQGVAIGSDGDIYVADSWNNRIEIFDSNGEYVGQISGPGATQFGGVWALAVGSSGNLYVADYLDSKVDIFTPDGTFVSSFGTYGTGDGQLKYPTSITTDASGNVYVGDGDGSNGRIEKFSSSGTYISQYGSYGSDPGKIAYPYGVAVDSGGNVYAAANDTIVNGAISKFTESGTYVTRFTYNTNPDPSQLCAAQAVSVGPDGNIYVSDGNWHNIKVYDPSGSKLLRVLDGDGLLGRLGSIAVSDDRRVYVQDLYSNDGIDIIDATNGSLISRFGTTRGTGDGQFHVIGGVAVDAHGNVYVTDINNERVQKFDSDGNYLSQFGSGGTGNGQFKYPTGVAFDSSGNIYVVERNGRRVQKFDSNGNYISQFGSSGAGIGQFQGPTGITIDRSDNIFVSDTDSFSMARIQKFDPAGNYLSTFGSYGTSDGQFKNIGNVATDSAGNVWATDTGTNGNPGKLSLWSPQSVSTAPQTLTASSTGTQSSMRLAWNRPVNTGGLSFTYMIRYRVIGASAWTTAAASLPSTATSYELSGLQPGTSYEAEVLVVNALGTSPAARVTFTTEGVVKRLADAGSPDELANTGVNIFLAASAAIVLMGAGVFAIMQLRRKGRV